MIILIIIMDVLFSSGNFFKVAGKNVKVNGKDHKFYELIIKDVVMVAVLNNKNELLFEKHFRPIMGKVLYELPAGYVDKGESPIKAAARELEEETGYKAKKIKSLFKSYISTGRSKQLMHFFIADQLTKGKKHKDPGEQIDDIVWIPLEKAVDMVKSGKIKGIDTTACILFLSQFLRKS
ncbi:MAG: NUDIX hydrolase [Candidatus Parvarchaeum acidophilus ARMAN-5]|uniref:NUDIX hydrolase n=1 Tax=Candidatus Parvarchaeum acidophilus ARMAN-5 TaxID=662762 RepID=D6GUH8_PARA5|nr:MAG: NUDIX hydrolase [Candidatus Parvarchaeum acidophilus ARMAN-5]